MQLDIAHDTQDFKTAACTKNSACYRVKVSDRSSRKGGGRAATGFYPRGGGLACGPVAQVMVHHAGSRYGSGKGVLEGHKSCGQSFGLGITLQ